MYENRIKHLQESHRLLDKQIETLLQNGLYEDLKLEELKKQRLLFKDEIARLTRLQWEHDHETVDYDDER
jgi:hypothetical protein